MEKELKRIFNKIGLALLIGYVLSNVVVFLIYVFFPETRGSNNYCVAQLLMILTSTLTAIPFGVIALRDETFDVGFKKVKIEKEKFLPVLFFTIIALCLSSLIVNLVKGICKPFGITFLTYELARPKNFLELVMMFMSVIVVPAVLEEFMFRGIILSTLEKYNKWAAVIISSCLFALYHVNIPQIIGVIGLSLYIGFVYVRTHSLVLTIAIHAFNNFMVCALFLAGENYAGLVMLCSIILGIISYLKLKRTGFFDVNFNEEEPKISGKAMRNCLITPFMILLFCLMVISTIFMIKIH